MKKLLLSLLCLYTSFEIHTSQFLPILKIEQAGLPSAISNNNIQAVRKALEAGENINSVSLSAAVEKGDEDMIKYLLENGIDINGEDSEGRTGLYVACAKSFENTALMLLCRGANPLISTKRSLLFDSVFRKKMDTALHAACRDPYVSIDVIEEILKAAYKVEPNCDFVNQQNADGKSCLHELCTRMNPLEGLNGIIVLKKLIAQGGNLNLPDNSGETPFYAAVSAINLTRKLDLLAYQEGKYKEILTILLQAGGTPEKDVRICALRKGFFLDIPHKKAFTLGDSDELIAAFIQLLESNGDIAGFIPCDSDELIAAFIQLLESNIQLLESNGDIAGFIRLLETDRMELPLRIITKTHIDTLTNIIRMAPQRFAGMLKDGSICNMLVSKTNNASISKTFDKVKETDIDALTDLILTDPESFARMIKDGLLIPQWLVLVKDDEDGIHQCPICCEFSLVVTRTQCGHIFHDLCLKKWYEEKQTCPICRSNLREPE